MQSAAVCDFDVLMAHRETAIDRLNDNLLGEERSRMAFRRLDEKFWRTEELLVEWGQHARHDGAPRWPHVTIIGRLAEDARGGLEAEITLSAPVSREILIIDWVVAQLPDIRRKVTYIEFVAHTWAPKEVKRRKLRMSATAWDRNLHLVRVSVLEKFTLFA